MIRQNPTTYGKVAVLLGGKSAEREISLLSGRAVFEALLRNNIDVHCVDAKDDVVGQLQRGNFDRVFNMLHGRFGEDGVTQGMLELMGLPYTGSGVLASALGMDKLKTKEVWIANNISTPDYCIVEKNSDLSVVVEKLGLPIIVKPLCEGSSIGMSKVEQASEFPDAVATAIKFDDKVLAEKWIVGNEYTVSILDGEALPIIRLEVANAFYDYDAKYTSNDTLYHCPSGLSSAKETELKKLALLAFDLVGAKSWGRVDMMLDEDDMPYLIEINTLPGMTNHSLVPMAAKAVGIEFDELVMKILDGSVS